MDRNAKKISEIENTAVKQDLVSVIMPVYNTEKYVGMAIDSVVRQVYENVELIVVDDGSTDGTVGCIRKCMEQWPGKIKLRIREKNGGTAAALNDAIELAEGKYICWLSADDFYADDMVKSEVDFLKRFTQYDAVFSRFVYVNENSEYLAEFKYEGDKKRCIEQGMPGIISSMLCCNLWNGCALLAKAECFKCSDRFDVNHACSQDYDFWLRLVADYDVGYLDQVNVFTRLHSEQGSVKMNVYLDEITVFFEILTREDIIKKLFARMKKKYTLENIMPYLEYRRKLYRGRKEELTLLAAEIEKYLLLIDAGKIHFED